MNKDITLHLYGNKYDYNFILKERITVVNDKGASGKTTFIRHLHDYINFGKGKLICDFECQILTNATWKSLLKCYQSNCVFFIDNAYSFPLTEDFKRYVQGSDCYFFIITRDTLDIDFYLSDYVYGFEVNDKSINLKRKLTPIYKEVQN